MTYKIKSEQVHFEGEIIKYEFVIHKLFFRVKIFLDVINAQIKITLGKAEKKNFYIY